MNTFLGASVLFHEKDLDVKKIKAAHITYLEGYLFDSDAAKNAFIKAAKIARDAGRQVALTLSDPFCVDRHRESFKALIADHIDILFANEAELLSLYEQRDFDAAMNQIPNTLALAFITRGEKGSVARDETGTYAVPALPVKAVIDTTGAGDQYAAGVLTGLTLGLSAQDCAYLGSHCAAEIISHYGARAQNSVHDLIVRS